jgi:hypothetical protein
MAHTFDIRFAKSEGLAGLFEAPANRLGWKGAGSLSIDAQGISIATKRGVLSLFPRRPRRFTASSLTEVYREGAALRLEFNLADSHEVLPVWASGSEAAAEIVKLLPTRKTVELEQAPRVRDSYRLDWRPIALAGAFAVALAVLVVAVDRPQATLDTDTAALVTPGEGLALEDRPAIASAPTARNLPLARTSPVYPAARRYADVFEAEIAGLLAEYIALMQAPSPVALEALASKWDAKLQQVQYQFEQQDAELVVLGDIQAGVCVNWRDFLRNYAEGLRTRNLDAINAAFVAREQAGAMRERMHWYVPD